MRQAFLGVAILSSVCLLYALHWLFLVPLNRVRKVTFVFAENAESKLKTLPLQLEDVGWRHLSTGRMRAEQVYTVGTTPTAKMDEFS